MNVVFIGFRHAHMHAMYTLLAGRGEVHVAAVCEEDPATREELARAGISVTHDSYTRMLDETDCDAVLCGDYFALRGQRVLQALERDKHVLSDKPLCTSLQELGRIRELSLARRLRVGCMLDLRDLGPCITLRRMIRAGCIGETHTVTFWGQHPMLYGKRPMWMFDGAKHGGTLNDVGVHGIDLIPWLTGREIVEVTAARVWNAKAKEHPAFQDGASMMLRLDNGGAVLGDLSYLSSDRHGYTMSPYWRFTLSGSEGVIETSCNEPHVTLWRHDRDEVIREAIAPARPGGYFEDFLADVRGTPRAEGLNTASVLKATSIALMAQQAAETMRFPVNVAQPAITMGECET